MNTDTIQAKNNKVAKFPVETVRRDFPALHQFIHNKPLVYFDNAATSQKPQCVIDAITHFYQHDNANVHRGIHTLSERATDAYENARAQVQRFINARALEEIIFVRGTTEAINLVANSYGRSHFKAGDEIIVSQMEHHSNIVPWQLVADQIGAVLKVIPINNQGEISLEDYQQLLSQRTKFVAITHLSNALGTINPVKKIIDIAHQRYIPVLLDGAQSAPHLPIDVQQLDCDFFAFSSHKIYGPTGTGVLYGKRELLEKMPPYQGGGDMIYSVSFDRTAFNTLPYKFEAGTPHIAGVIGLGRAIEYLQALDRSAVFNYEQELSQYALQQLLQIPHLRIIGNQQHSSGVISFMIDDIHPHDIGTILNYEGIAVRSGHHCAMPVMQHFGVPATVRVSLAFYNTQQEVDVLVAALAKVREVLK